MRRRSEPQPELRATISLIVFSREFYALIRYLLITVKKRNSYKEEPLSRSLIRITMADSDYFICPQCGNEVRVGSKGCKHCAPIEASEEDTYLDGIDLPDDEFDYEEFTEREFGGKVKPRGIKPIWWVTGIVLLIIWIYSSM